MDDDSIEDNLDCELEKETLFLRDDHSRLESHFSDELLTDEEEGNSGKSLSEKVDIELCDLSGAGDVSKSALLGAMAKAKPLPFASSSGLASAAFSGNFGACVELTRTWTCWAFLGKGFLVKRFYWWRSSERNVSERVEKTSVLFLSSGRWIIGNRHRWCGVWAQDYFRQLSLCFSHQQ